MHDDHSRPFFDRSPLIHIIDPDTATREALGVALRLAGYQTALALDARRLLGSPGRRSPDAIIINLQLGRGDAFLVLRQLAATHRGIPVLVLGNRPRVDHAVAAMKCGAADVLTTPVDDNRLADAVGEALRERRVLGAVRRDRADHARRVEQLTPRERQVMPLIAQGQTNKEVGKQLGISPRTVEVHRARVLDKLGARNAADLLRILLTG